MHYHFRLLRASTNGSDALSTISEVTLSFTFAQVEAALASCHDIADNKRSAFANRLKHLQKLGFLPEIKTGRGKAAAYKGQHIYLLGLALEFIELGLTPERTILTINQNLNFVLIPTRFALASLNKDEVPFPYFIRFDPSSLNSLRYDDPEDDDASATLSYAGVGTMAELIKDMGTLWPRLAVINVTSLVSHTFSSLHEVKPDLGERYEKELTAWLDTYPDHEEGDEYENP